MAFKLKGWSPFTQKDDKKKKETKQQRLTEAMGHVEGEDKDIQLPKGKQSNSELTGDIEDRIEFNRNDLESGRITKKQYNAINRRLNRRLGYLRQNK